MPLGESGWVWVGAASWPAGVPDGAGLTGLRRTRPCRTLRRRAKGGRAASSLTPSETLKSQREAALSLSARSASLKTKEPRRVATPPGAAKPLFPSILQERHQGRLKIAPGSATLGLWPSVVLEFKQRGLARLRRLPFRKLRPSRLEEDAPAIGAPLDDDGVGPFHAACATFADACKPFRKSAARCAWDAAEKIARLSCFKTLSHDSM